MAATHSYQQNRKFHSGQDVGEDGKGQCRVDSDSSRDAAVLVRLSIQHLVDGGKIDARRVQPATVDLVGIGGAMVDEPLFADPNTRQRQGRMTAQRKTQGADPVEIGGQVRGGALAIWSSRARKCTGRSQTLTV